MSEGGTPLFTVESEVLVVGAGPAGMAAATTARQAGSQVTLVDDNPGIGGQIWRGAGRHAPSAEARKWVARVHGSDIRFIHGARVISHPQARSILAESDDTVYELRFRRLILATGARERFLPFPGWTLPGVVGAGGLQALVKSGAPIRGATVVIAGSGPLLLAVGSYLKKRGARVSLIAEQAPFNRLVAFWLWLARHHPLKAVRGVMLTRPIGARYLAGSWVVEATGKDKLASVTLRRGN